MLDCLIVGAGGAIGAVLRYLISKMPLEHSSGFPLRTFIVNVIGCFVIGAVAAMAAKQLSDDPRAVLFLKAGVCGGFTTFSSFALETVGLFGSGAYLTGAVYAGLSVAAGTAAVAAAQYIFR